MALSGFRGSKCVSPLRWSYKACRYRDLLPVVLVLLRDGWGYPRPCLSTCLSTFFSGS